MRLWGRKRREDDLDRELRSHLDLEVEEQQERGLSSEEARYAAQRALGNTTLIKEDVRAMARWTRLESAGADLRYAARLLRKTPSFTAAIVATLALGIGANTAIFSVCDAVLLKPLPYLNPNGIVMLWEKSLHEETLEAVAPANFVDWREQTRSFEEIAAINPYPTFVLTGRGEPVRLAGAGVSSNFFSLLGTRITVGRGFLEEEDRPGRDRVAILSYSTWRHRLGGDPDVVGEHVTLNDISYTVVGVLPREFEFVSKASDFQARNQFDVWVPLALDHLEKLQRNHHPLRVFARVKPGIALTQAQADLNVVGANLAQLFPEWNKERGIAAIPLIQQVTTNVRTALRTLLGAVGLVLLIACANVANLLLSRAAARQKEMALRMALGAGRSRLAQQLLIESLLLAIVGGGMGLLLASGAIRTLTPYLPPDLPRASGITVDVRVLAFTGLISLATGILFGLAPMFRAYRANANEALKQSTRMAGGIPSRMRSGLVVAEMAIAVVLLTGAGLMAKSFWALLHVAPGFRTEQILTARLTLPGSRYPDARRIAAFQHELLDGLRNAPGVQGAGLSAYLPLSGTDNAWGFVIEGRPPLPTGEYNVARYRPVSPGYFETIGIPLLRGRGFRSVDDEDLALVAVINESMARKYWGQENPVGQRLQFGPPTWRTVIGVVGDVHHEDLAAEPRPEMYVPFSEAPNNDARTTIVVRALVDPTAVTAILRKVVSAIDPGVPLDQVATMEQLVSASVGQPRLRTTLLAGFSILALVIAATGIYGVMSYLVIQRTREFGIRVAVGATKRDVLRLVLRRAAVLVVSGLCLGMLGAVALTRVIASLLYGVTPLDPLTFAAVPFLLSAVALSASSIPARRATRIDPMVALRHE
jgi:putative ABC transport system permease protein